MVSQMAHRQLFKRGTALEAGNRVSTNAPLPVYGLGCSLGKLNGASRLFLGLERRKTRIGLLPDVLHVLWW
jgi:hypothetical protein